MSSYNAKADAAMARKYGPAAWERMPNWGKVRNRLSQRIYEAHNRRMLLAAMSIPAVMASVVVALVAAVIR